MYLSLSLSLLLTRFLPTYTVESVVSWYEDKKSYFATMLRVCSAAESGANFSRICSKICSIWIQDLFNLFSQAKPYSCRFSLQFNPVAAAPVSSSVINRVSPRELGSVPRVFSCSYHQIMSSRFSKRVVCVSASEQQTCLLLLHLELPFQDSRIKNLSME